MRDLTKSMFSLSWAMSLFGVQQMVNLMKPSKAAKAFDNVTEAAKEDFDDVTKKTFQAGDDFQRRVVDMTLGVFNLDALNPGRMIRMTCDMTQRAADAVGQSVRGTASGCTGASQGGGRGPMGGSSAAASSAREQAQGTRQAQQAQPSPRPQSKGWGPMPG
jgi:hypothetical protein